MLPHSILYEKEPEYKASWYTYSHCNLVSERYKKHQSLLLHT